jgi:plasmid fertility inhibition factor
MKYFVFKNMLQQTYAVFRLGNSGERYFMKISKSQKSKHVVIIRSNLLAEVLSSEMQELVDDFDHGSINTHNSEQKIPKALEGFSYGKENGVPLARLHLHEDEITPSFTDGRTRTAFLIHKKIPLFPISTDKSSADEMKKNNLIDDSFGIVKGEELFDPKSEVYRARCEGFVQQDYVSPDPKLNAIYLEHKKALQ